MGRYAADTSVPADRSRAEIEKVLARYGARAFGYATDGNRAMITFKVLDEDGTGLAVRILLPLPDPADPEFTRTPTGKARDPDAARTAWEKATRSSWRSLLLVIKAKLEAVESGISTVEREFMADVLLPSGDTIGERVAEQRPVLEQGGNLKLLPAG